MESGKKKRWLYGLIALLFLASAIEAGFLISKKDSKSKPVEENQSRIVSKPASPVVPRRTQPLPSPLQQVSGNTDAWDSLLGEFHRMQDEMNRVFGESYGRFLGSPAMQAPLSSFLGGTEFSPAIDVQEQEKAYIAKADLPGLEKDKIQLSVSGNVLTIQGERKQETEKQDTRKGYYAAERSYGSFSRSVSLPGPVDESAVTADYKNGVLTITLPKLKGSAGQARQVQIT